MKGTDKPIGLSNHAKTQLAYRGTNENEIVQAIRESPWKPSELGRMECRKDFPYNQLWNGKHYKTKQVRPIFADEKEKIVIITVYFHYF